MTPHHHITEFGNNLIYFSSQDIFLTAKWPNVLFTSHNSFKNTCGKCVEQLPNMEKKNHSRIAGFFLEMGKLRGNLVGAGRVILSKCMSFFFWLVGGWGVGFCVWVWGDGRCSVIKHMILWYLFLLYTEICKWYLFFPEQTSLS